LVHKVLILKFKIMNSNIKIEEYHVVGQTTVEEFIVCKDDFKNFSPDYDDPFETNFKAKITAVTGIVTAFFYISELKGLTNKLISAVKGVYKKLNLTERYLKRTKSELTKPWNFYGVREARKAARSGNVEGLDIALNNLFANLALDHDKLMAHGMTDEFVQEFKDLAQTIVTNNDKQEVYKTTKAQAIEDNHVLFDDLLATIRDVQETGKALYKDVSQAKTDAFTMAVVLRRIRHEVAPTEEIGLTDIYVNCQDKDGNLLEALTVTVVETGQTAETDSDGQAFLEGVSNETVKEVSFKIEGETWITKTTEKYKLVPGEDLTIDVEMDAEPV
jgi:hypothetical protein